MATDAWDSRCSASGRQSTNRTLLKQNEKGLKYLKKHRTKKCKILQK